MHEFAAISVSTYDPDSLVAQLNERSADGWSVVSIVPTGSTITAYLSRAASGDVAATTASDDAAAAAAPEPAPEPAAEEPASAAEGGEGWAASAATAAAITPEPASEPTLPSTGAEPAAAEPAPAAAEPAAEQATVAPAAEPAASAAAPAGWYADPSARYELRYWDGSTWTEHVSRGGQQFTDPPVA